ncbi:PREDICTED: CAAX prenyl protease 2-like, partial [Priapulus caudatus]|uniref:CAAX prenyl protease 2 n=1 Tax=Priapulus caudatus TaxID=37621 RepID=A0ABM1DV53_PRICU
CFRDHPETIKRRFISVFVVCCIAPIYLKKLVLPSYPEIFEEHTLWQWLGVKVNGLAIAILLPCLLTMILFMGPLMLQYLDGLVPLYLGHIRVVCCRLTPLQTRLYAAYVAACIATCDDGAAPISRGSSSRVSVSPLSAITQLKKLCNRTLAQTFINVHVMFFSVFQFSYTTIFGTYSAFLFLRTGHLAAPFVAHSFCNHMGFPAFNEVLSHRHPKRTFIALSYIVGLLLWIYLMWSATDPMWFANDVYTL